MIAAYLFSFPKTICTHTKRDLSFSRKMETDSVDKYGATKEQYDEDLFTFQTQLPPIDHFRLRLRFFFEFCSSI